jgi:hypothetical protein
MYGTISGQQLLQNFASSPKFALLASDFSALITTTLAQVIDELCFYVIGVLQPAQGTCYSSGTTFVIQGYNMFSLGTPKCRWQEVGTSNYIYTDATINATDVKLPYEPGDVGLVICAAPVVNADLNAYLEVSRDGTYFTNNQYSVLIRSNCSAPVTLVCPNASIAAVFSACNMSDFNGHCSPTCLQASDDLGAAFQAHSIYPAFSTQDITNCMSNYPSPASLTSTDKAQIIDKTAAGQGPCSAKADQQTTSSANVAGLFLSLSALISLALS